MKSNSILSIQAGMPMTVGDAAASDPMLQTWTSGIFKQQLSGSVHITKDGLPGDGHVYEGHGGPDKAVFVHAAVHYTFWEQKLGLKDMPFGGLGENFTTEGMLETDVCIGDVYRVGSLLLQVSQPRPPCWKLSRRFGIKQLSLLIEETCRTGFYFRVLEEGECQAGDTFSLQDRPAPEWNTARVYHIYQDVASYMDEAKFLSRSPYLAERMRRELEKYYNAGSTIDKHSRLIGPNE